VRGMQVPPPHKGSVLWVLDHAVTRIMHQNMSFSDEKKLKKVFWNRGISNFREYFLV